MKNYRLHQAIQAIQTDVLYDVGLILMEPEEDRICMLHEKAVVDMNIPWYATGPSSGVIRV